MINTVKQPALSPDLGAPNPQGMPPAEQGPLPVQGPGQKLTENSVSWQRVMNERVPSFVNDTNILDPHAAEARQAVHDAIQAGEAKEDARGFIDRDITWPGAVENQLPASPDHTAAFEKHVDDIDFWLRTKRGVTIIGGYGEDREALQRLVEERAVREGFDPSEVTIITMAEGMDDPEMVRRETHDKAAVITHSAGAGVLDDAYEGEDTSYWRRPGLVYFHNPPSGHRRPLAKPASESKEMSLPQLIVGALLVSETDKVSQPEGWRLKRWGKEVSSNKKASLKAFLLRIVGQGRHFDEFASSLADQPGTQVIIPVSRRDYFFYLTQQSRDRLAEHGAAVVEPKVGDGYHNDVVFKPEQTTAEIDEELAAMVRELPEDSQVARDYAARRRIIEARRRYAADQAADNDAHDDENDDRLVGAGSRR